MTDIARLQGINPKEVERLQSKQVATVDDLWARIGADFDCGIDQVADLTGVERGRLTELLATEALREAKVGEGPRLKRYALEVILIAVLLILVALALRALGLPT
jgi:hypothetical protein